MSTPLDKGFVSYEDFGAVGDGVTNDFAAIKRAHDYANENGLTVVTNSSKTYYVSDTRINGVVETAIIKTDVDFGDTKFIIDDSPFIPGDETRVTSAHIFRVESDYPVERITDREVLSRLDGIGEGTRKLDLALGYPAMIVVYDENKHVYGRSGAHYKNSPSHLGPAKNEVILIDAVGNVDESTPFIFEYDTVTRVEIFRTDVRPLTVKGGIFTTVAARGPDGVIDENCVKLKGFPYVSRGFNVRRPFTTVKGMRHYTEGYITTKEHVEKHIVGAHYTGFFVASYANDVLLEDCVLTGRRYYGISGTYDFSADHVNIIRLKNCVQSNFKMENEAGESVYSMATSPLTRTRYCWGIGGTNFCKNMEYIGCTLSRFDAHMGLLNGKIINSRINYISITGKGKLIIENVDWESVDKGFGNNSFVLLRRDYGSTWDGEVIARDVRITAADPGAFSILFHIYSNFVYGYECKIPNLDFDGIKINGIEKDACVPILTESKSVLLEPALHLPVTTKTYYEDDEGNKSLENRNPILPPKYFNIKNASHRFVISDSDFFSDTEIIGVERISKEEYNYV